MRFGEGQEGVRFGGKEGGIEVGREESKAVREGVQVL